MALHLAPIGYVRATEGQFWLEIAEPYRPALEGLEGFSHLIVIWWCHMLDTPEYRSSTICTQPYRQSPATLGVFATRSPARPNPIALTPVALLGVDAAQGTVAIPYIDAEDGSPILDLKPYHPSVDRIRAARVPVWCQHWPQWYEDAATFDWEAEFVNAQ